MTATAPAPANSPSGTGGHQRFDSVVSIVERAVARRLPLLAPAGWAM